MQTRTCSPVRLFVFAYWTQHFVRFLKLKFNVKALDKTNRPKVISIPIGWLSLIKINWVGLNDKRVTATKNRFSKVGGLSNDHVWSRKTVHFSEIVFDFATVGNCFLKNKVTFLSWVGTSVCTQYVYWEATV